MPSDLTTILNREDAPTYLFSIPELDFSDDLFAEPLRGHWFRLGAWTITPQRDKRGLEDVVSRQSVLLPPECFSSIFDKLNSVGSVFSAIGRAGGYVGHADGRKEYRYIPFHSFEFPFSSTLGEPLVFVRDTTSGIEFLINPDLWIFFELEEKTKGSGIWWDPRRGTEVLRQRRTGNKSLEIVEIRTEYLVKYLQVRQLSLIVGHYRHLHLFGPSPSTIQTFVQEDVTLGSPEAGAKALLQNWGLRRDIWPNAPFLQRRLHLWFEIRPPAIDVEDPWADVPPFDPYTFTLPTQVGQVAPVRWRRFRGDGDGRFEGNVCDFMAPVYFRQDVLRKYEGASGFEVADDGSVSCRHYWGLVRSTHRLGNELLFTAIGDFAEGVPFEEWPHWKQYAVEPPSDEATAALGEEQTLPAAVNSLCSALNELNASFAELAGRLGVATPGPLWRGALDSLAGRQLKWVYTTDADDDEFLKRATLASTWSSTSCTQNRSVSFSRRSTKIST